MRDMRCVQPARAILFVAVYAAYDLYHFIGVQGAFLLMVAVTSTMFWLAIRIGFLHTSPCWDSSAGS